MNNYFLLNESVSFLNYLDFKSQMLQLLVIEREVDDLFLKHQSIWDINVFNSLFSTFGQEEQIIVKFIEQMKSIEDYPNNEETLDSMYEFMSNAFLGCDFSRTTIAKDRQVTNEETFKIFKFNTLWDVTFRNFWHKRTKLFPSLTLCGEVEKQISNIGNSNQFNQIIDRLKEFNSAISNWTHGDFSYRTINENYALRISPESEQTMNRYGSERSFKMPTGRTEVFELHIKTGLFRFHFYPSNTDRKVYIGYIGPHLTTVSN